MKKIYKYRGFILGTFSLVLINTNYTPLCEIYVSSFILIGILFFLGVFLRIFARMSIGKHSRGYAHEAPYLITTGAYSLMRHPLYVSNTLIATSAIIFHLGLNIQTILFFIPLILFEFFLSKSEDLFLKETFASQWIDWAKRTWAFFPKLKNYISTPQRTPIFTAIHSDKSTWFWLFLLFLVIYCKKVF